jgi:hypothetical protein
MCQVSPLTGTRRAFVMERPPSGFVPTTRIGLLNARGLFNTSMLGVCAVRRRSVRGVAVDDEHRVTVAVEDRRGSLAVFDLHEDRLSVMVAAGDADDRLHTAWAHLRPEEARMLAREIVKAYGVEA